MARAFVDDPVFSWMLPSRAVRERRLAHYFSTALRHEAPGHENLELAWTDNRIVGGTIWFPPPGRYIPSASHQLRALLGYLAVFRGRLGVGQAYMRSALSAHPREPHWYLGFVGVEPELQGQGIGAELIRSRLSRCDSGDEAAYLESSNVRNNRLYMHLGFRPTGVLPLPAGAPEVTTMWRPPPGAPAPPAPSGAAVVRPEGP